MSRIIQQKRHINIGFVEYGPLLAFFIPILARAVLCGADHSGDICAGHSNRVALVVLRWSGGADDDVAGWCGGGVFRRSDHLV